MDFGRFLADTLIDDGPCPVLLNGALGAGKTTLVSAMVNALPGGEDAEVSSPSFTIYNIYPTSPPAIHCDLYRCRRAIPQEVEEWLEDSTRQIFIEWSEYLPVQLPLFLDISINVINNNRLVKLAGERSSQINRRLMSDPVLSQFLIN